jgi:hypothetical protein
MALHLKMAALEAIGLRASMHNTNACSQGGCQPAALPVRKLEARYAQLRGVPDNMRTGDLPDIDGRVHLAMGDTIEPRHRTLSRRA